MKECSLRADSPDASRECISPSLSALSERKVSIGRARWNDDELDVLLVAVVVLVMVVVEGADMNRVRTDFALTPGIFDSMS